MNICNVISHKFYIKTHKNKKHKPENVCYCYKKCRIQKTIYCVIYITSTQTQCLAIGHYVHINVWNIICCHDNCKGREGEKKYPVERFTKCQKHSRQGLNRKKKSCIEGTWIYKKSCQITQAVRDLNKKYNVFLCKEQNVKSLTWKMIIAGCDNMKYLQ